MSTPAHIRRLIVGALACVPLVAAAPPARAAGWCVDKAHSAVGFSIRHLVSRVPGSFREVDGTVQFDPAEPAASAVDVTVQAASIDTGNARRDGHLRSADFFDVEKFKTLTFKSEKVVPKSKDEYDVTGALTIHGVTKTVTVPVTLLGLMDTPKMGRKAGFEARFTISRKEFGITYNDPTGTMLGDEVAVTLNFELNDAETCAKMAEKAKAAAPPAAAPPAAPAPAPAK